MLGEDLPEAMQVNRVSIHVTAQEVIFVALQRIFENGVKLRLR